jgi:hypothetical protein
MGRQENPTMTQKNKRQRQKEINQNGKKERKNPLRNNVH